MRLWLIADSQNKIGYIPDWIKITYQLGEDVIEFSFDLQGETDYNADTLNCRFKGNLIPWERHNLTTGIIRDFKHLSEAEREKYFPDTEILKIFCQGKLFEIGIYPADSSESNFLLAEKDILRDRRGTFEVFNMKTGRFEGKRFSFGTKLTGL